MLWANNDGVTRGFTDHEHLDDLGLAHMNGRIYDPVLARFLSADPFIDGTSDSQGYNRYSYVHNNPLNATDPTGFLSLKDVVKIVAIVVVAYFTAGWGAGALGPSISAGFGVSAAVGAGIGGGFAAGFASGFAGSLLNGGSIGDAFQAGVVGGVIGAISGGVAGGIGDLAAKYEFQGDWLHHALHGVSQGAVTEAFGGDFRHGFYAAAFSSLATDKVSTRIEGDSGRTIAAAVIGGTASVLGGGKFANGATTGAFTYLFNSALHHNYREKIDPELRRAHRMAVNEILAFAKANPGDPIPLSDEKMDILMRYDAIRARYSGWDELGYGDFITAIQESTGDSAWFNRLNGREFVLDSGAVIATNDFNYYYQGMILAARGYGVFGAAAFNVSTVVAWNVKDAFKYVRVSDIEQISPAVYWSGRGYGFYQNRWGD
ncbi:MAG: RHS repeat-associated core domain-containing protein [Opitutaceae bacterium]